MYTQVCDSMMMSLKVQIGKILETYDLLISIWLYKIRYVDMEYYIVIKKLLASCFMCWHGKISKMYFQ